MTERAEQPGLTEAIAAQALSLSAEALPPEVAAWAMRAIADTIACGLAGADEAAPGLMRRLLPAGEPDCAATALIWGRGERRALLDAAQINGTAAHALDFDDCNVPMDGHPSVSVVPGLVALAESRHASGAELLTAYVAGIEAEIRLARLSNPAHSDRGWHPTVTFGVIGAAVAAARLLRLSLAQTRIAIGIAASSAAGLRANSGTMTKPFHAGMATRNGIQAALLAELGMSANPGALEHKFGYLNAFSGGANPEAGAVMADWGSRWEVLDPGIAIKGYPCCAFIHSAIDAAAELRALPGFDAANITAITVELHPRRLRNIDRPHPRDDLDARFSTQYLTARALLAGNVTLSDFDTPWVADPAASALSGKVTLSGHDAADLSFGRVTLSFADGSRHSASASVAMGRGPKNPMTPAQFEAKFLDCATRSLDEATARNLLASLLDLPGVADVAALASLFSPASPRILSSKPQ